MSSMGNMKAKFSMEDFEKGLMLLGLLTPKSTEEICEKIELEKLEQSTKADNSKTYFKRVVLAAEIVNQLRTERTFGRIKFQKLVYMCEHIAKMGLASRYAKFAAGPFDNKFMHSINKELKKQRWFESEQVQDGNYVTIKYHPLANQNGYRGYYDSYFGSCNQSIQSIIELFRHKKTEETELVATTLACILELSSSTNTIEQSTLFEVFYSWHDKKKRFTQSQIISAIKLLQTSHLMPPGIEVH